jgi:serine/threonine-protein kinase
MPKPQKVDELLQLVRRSGLVERDRLNRVLLQLKRQAGGQPITDIEFVGRRLVEAGLLSQWQCNNLVAGRHKGFFLKRYKLLDHLGTGGMSSVYLAEHVLMHRRVAIKVLPRDKVEDSSYLARFYREAQAAAALDHRNIVRAYDVDNDGNNHFMVMEYVEGRDLLTMVKEDGPLDYPAAADYVRQAAEGLAHAHEAGLVHRDVKPANLLVDRRNVVKLLDLGLARFTGEEYASLTVAHDENVLGTADYLAPEQALDSHGVDARADLYSLGCSFYYVLTGRPPFPDGTLPQRLMMHQKDTPPSILEARPDAPEELVGLCMWMMAKKPADRPQTAAEVAGRLADWLTAHGYEFETGSSLGGSSGKLAAAAASARSQSAAAEGSAKHQLRRAEPGSGAAARHVVPKADSDLRPDKPFLPGAADAGSRPRRQKGNGANRPAKSPQRAAVPGNSHVLVQPPGREPMKDEGPAGVLEAISRDGSPVVARLRARRPTSSGQLPASRSRRDETPLWVWIVIGAGTLLAAALLVVFLLTRL